MATKKRRLTVTQRALAAQCTSECALLFYRLMEAGLYETGQKMRGVVESVGWELAGLAEEDDG